jgi:hypothetical protein
VESPFQCAVFAVRDHQLTPLLGELSLVVDDPTNRWCFIGTQCAATSTSWLAISGAPDFNIAAVRIAPPMKIHAEYVKADV